MPLDPETEAEKIAIATLDIYAKIPELAQNTSFP